MVKTGQALSRRKAAAIAATTTVAGVAAVTSASSAAAATGQPVVQGAANNAGAGGTSLVSASTKPTLTVRNDGTGAGAFFQAVNNNGFAGGTLHGNKYGLSAANSGSAGSGAGMAASGINNTGVLANTNNQNKFAVDATCLAATSGMGGGVLADGGVGTGLVAFGQDLAAYFGGFTYIHSAFDCLTATASYTLQTKWTDIAGQAETTGVATLDGTGAASIALPAWMNAAAQVTTLVTPNSGPMPNLWASVDSVSAALKISGGVAGGTVSYSATGLRTDRVAVARVSTNAIKKAAKNAQASRAAKES